MKYIADIINSMEEFDEDDLSDTSDLPSSLIITNVHNDIYLDENLRGEFEHTFLQFDDQATFQYFKSFRRVRVNFTAPGNAAKARIQCHEMKFGESIVNCYFAQPLPSPGNSDGDTSDSHLQLPTPVRQFLISPPASPPVGWEPADEAQPCVNYDLLAALAKLAPGEAHELHPPSKSQPGIVVHICEDPGNDRRGMKITQTRRPNNVNSTS